MPSNIEEGETARLTDETAKQPDATEPEAMLGDTRDRRDGPPPSHRPYRERLREFYQEFPLPEPTGLKADKAFFDEMYGEFD